MRSIAAAAASPKPRRPPAAADGYADAAGRWEQFGVVPEHAFALLGHGRCLVRVGQSHNAVPILNNAREIFQALGAND